MTTPSVDLVERDGALGVQTDGSALVIVMGCSPAGTVGVPTPIAKRTDLTDIFTTGGASSPALELAALVLDAGLPVLFTRVASATPGDDGTLVTSAFTGSSVPTLDAGNDTTDGVDVLIEFPTGGTVGTTGINYRYSLDGGVNFEALKSLGTAVLLTIPELGTFQVNLAAGTIAAGSKLMTRTTARQPDSTGVQSAMDALKVWKGGLVEFLLFADQCTSAIMDVLDQIKNWPNTVSKDLQWAAPFRIPALNESEATYLAAFKTIFDAKATTFGSVCAGAAQTRSAISGRSYIRPGMFAAFAREVTLSPEANNGDPDLGNLDCSIRDANGNPRHHDETANPGLDDARAYVLRTHEEFEGTYVNIPRLLSPSGSDFRLVSHRRVMNTAKRIIRRVLKRRTNKPIRVNKKTGRILEIEALEIEKLVNVALEQLLNKPMASDVLFTLSRTDNVLSTRTLTGQFKLTPLANPEKFIVDPVSFVNPALKVLPVAA